MQPFQASDVAPNARRTAVGEVAVIGCGGWGKNLVRNFHELGALRTVCDANETGRRAATRLAPNVKIESDFEQVLHDASTEAVVIATPAETHFRLATRALSAGKDVFVEKPLALNYADAASLVRLANKQRRILMVGHVLEYHPAVERAKQLIEQGVLGRVQYVYSNRLSLGKIRREENILWSFAPHDIAVILRLMGSPPFQVSATGGNYVQPNLADVTVTNLLFDNGVRAHIHVSWLHPFKEQRLVVIGSKKMISFDDVNKRLLIYDQRVDMEQGVPVPVRGDGCAVEFSQDEPLRLECEAFLRAVATREPPLTDGGSGLQVIRVLQAAQQSLIMNGQPVALALESVD